MPTTHLTSSKNLSSSRKETSEYLGEKQDRKVTGGGRREERCEGLLWHDTRITGLDTSPGLFGYGCSEISPTNPHLHCTPG